MNPSHPESTVPPASLWAEQVAAQLRLLMSTSADDARETRGVYLEAEIQQGLAGVPAGSRADYLAALAEKFPTGAQFDHALPAQETTSATASRLETIDDALAFLARATTNLSAPEKRALGARMAALGLADVPVAECFSELKQKLGLNAQDGCAASRAASLLALETDFLTKLDQLAWKTWRRLAPKPVVKREAEPGDLRGLLRRYVRGDADVSDVQLGQHLDRTRQLVASLIGALSQVSRGFATRYRTRHAPAAIRDLIQLEGAKWHQAFRAETRCWRKYVELAEEITDSSLEAEMQDVVARYVDDVMRGTARNPA